MLVPKSAHQRAVHHAELVRSQAASGPPGPFLSSGLFDGTPSLSRLLQAHRQWELELLLGLVGCGPSRFT
jgi:hypothetical protein